ncbi:MAG: hypothetical protein J5J00_14820 [Deltaproteobacteria bacterium]|nr:hypothetical protein [Deltaproteobacteria bacterium]
MPSNASRLVGHKVQRSFLEKLLRIGALPPATLLAGSSGIGKKLVALELIRSILCEQNGSAYGGCGECKGCLLFGHSNHPDFTLVDCSEKEQANVEAIRHLLYSLHLRPYQSSSRLVLFDNADHLSLQSSNALLKSLEEPRNHTHYFLICSNPHRLPATIVSRCQVWYFDDLNTEQIRTIAQKSELVQRVAAESGATIDELCLMADGTLENIGEISARHGNWSDLRNVLISMAAGDVPLAIESAATLAKDKEALRADLKLLRAMARHELHKPGDARQRASWARAILDLISAENLIYERNLSASQVLTNVFLRLAAPPASLSFTHLDHGATFLEQQLLN